MSITLSGVLKNINFLLDNKNLNKTSNVNQMMHTTSITSKDFEKGGELNCARVEKTIEIADKTMKNNETNINAFD